jgi:hypothetical protein
MQRPYKANCPKLFEILTQDYHQKGMWDIFKPCFYHLILSIKSGQYLLTSRQVQAFA